MTEIIDEGASAYGLGLPGALPRDPALTELLAVTRGVITDVLKERDRQLARWGDQHHRDGTGGPRYRDLADIKRRVTESQARGADGATWMAISEEELYEAFAETDPTALDAELVQAAAVLVAWLVDLRRRRVEVSGATAPAQAA